VGGIHGEEQAGASGDLRRRLVGEDVGVRRQRVRERKMRIIIISLWLLATVTVCTAQKEKRTADEHHKPDLSGTWTLDKSRSDKVGYDLTLNILHREPEIRITKKYVEDGRALIEESVYYTDGRAAPADAKPEYIFKPVTKWRGRTLIRETIHITKGTKFEVVTTEEWKLSQDGRTLTRVVVNRQNVSANEVIFPRLERKSVFTRTP
jgi:hypothetical protein